MSNRCVVFDGAMISYEGPTESAPASAPSVRPINVPTVLPGHS